MKIESIRSILFATLAFTGVATCSFFTGCKPEAGNSIAKKEGRQEQQPQAELKAQQALEEIRGKIQPLTAEGKWDEALEIIKNALADSGLETAKGLLMSEKIGVYLAANRLDDAKAETRALLSDAPDDFYPCAQKIYSFEMTGKQYQRALDWCKTFTASDLEIPSGAREALLFDQLEPAIILKNKNETLPVLNALPVTNDLIRSRLEGVLTRQIEKGDTTFLSAIFQEMQDSTKNPQIAEFYLIVLIRSEVAKKDWGKVTRLLPHSINTLDDRALTRCCRIIFTGMKKAKATPLLENAAKLVITQAKGKENASGLAARVWFDSGIRKDPKLFTVRLDALLDAKINPNQVGDLLDQYFYRNINDRKLVAELCDRGEKLITICTDTNTVNALKVKVLDGAFIVEDYAKAIRMLEKGIPGKNKEWHDMSIPKVKAHLALKQKNPRLAITHFREFMKVWKNQKQDEEFDPTTDISHSKEWILARNALRIAKIYDTIPDAEGARKAREEARGYVVIAKEKAAKNPEAMKLLNKEFAELK